MPDPRFERPPLPDELEDRVLAIVDRKGGDTQEAIEALCREHSEHADSIRDLAGMSAPPTGDVERIGRYRILDTLGEGGMGTVFLAEQREPVRRRVALKVIKLGMDSKQVLARFELERQTLAVMNHPAIAKVFDAGISGAGQPYFVMEFVEGISLTDYCDEHRLSLRERIGIFQDVCRGVQHAHQKGVLHRDLKPGNILVSRKDDQHVVKVIDFGLARATDQQMIDQTILTEQGQMIGTPEYMSPEQAGGSALHIDTRTDIYSLGVVLYELLAGELPFGSMELRQKGLLDVQRIIREKEPSKPSTRVSSVGVAVSDAARRRRLSPVTLRRHLRGDLDWIVMRAMAKEPERRYASALDLALDLGHYLQHEPVEAGPPSTIYRVSKFVRRYRVHVAAATAVMIVTIGGALVATRFAVEATRKAEEAERERARLYPIVIAAQLDKAEAEQQTLLPAWPDRIDDLRTWLQTRARALEREFPKVQRVLRTLEAKARAQTEEQRQADRRTHAEYPNYLALQKKVTALRRAMAVRTGASAGDDVPLPEGTPDEPDAINEIAWPRVDPERDAQAYGDEAMGLALARRAMHLAESTNSVERHNYGDTLAWALFYNGLFDEAKVASTAALAAAPADEKQDYRRNLNELTDAIAGAKRTLEDAERELARLDGELDRRHTWEFADRADEFLHKTLLKAERDLTAFLGETGNHIDVKRRLDWAERIGALTEDHPNASVTWAEARAALEEPDGVVASELYSKRYHDEHPISLRPQLGLVPIGMNPVTKLWEFYHLRSAHDPRTAADAAAIAIPKHAPDGSIPVTEGTGIVFVLLPGGKYTMGAQKADPHGGNFCEHAKSDEPVSEVTVAPFFLARHELTQGQWMRLSLRENPSSYRSGSRQARAVGGGVTARHPVESVDWNTATAAMARHGLYLPHEREWEYGCRAGRSTSWSFGNERALLRKYGNVSDERAKAAGLWEEPHESFDDGHVIHAPVGSYEPNAFGLYDGHGNVWEWCSNAMDRLSQTRVNRGGCYLDDAILARSACRDDDDPRRGLDVIGIRAARALR